MTINLLWQFILIAMYIQQGSLMYIASTVPNVGLTTEQNTGLSRAISKRDGRAYYSDYNDSGRRGDDHDQDMPMDQDQDNDDMKEESRVDYWNGYYDFLINEGSYKFWAVFQLSTAALLIYSGFAALYYAKINPPAGDYDEEFFLRRRRRSWSTLQPDDDNFLGLGSENFQRIIDAIAREFH